MFQRDRLADLIQADRCAGPKLDEIGQRLMLAAEIIQQRGWTRGVACDQQGAVCLMGAIYDVREESPCVPNIMDPLHIANLSAEAMIRLGKTASWNDAHGRSKEQVIDALTSAALKRMAP